MLRFSLATIVPFFLLAMAAFMGGVWVFLAFASMTVFVFAMDRILPRIFENPDPHAEFPASDALLVALGLGHFAVLWLLIMVFGNGPDFARTGLEKGGILVTAGLIFGQMSHPVAHELIHRSARAKHLLGKLVYATMLVGHHASAHLRVHHVYVATDDDPNSARMGESFYQYVRRAGPGAFKAGLAAENRLRKGRRENMLRHPYTLYLVTGALTLFVAMFVSGISGFFAVLIASLHGQVQILLSDYVQHYGLRRERVKNSRYEPVGPQHSWNSPHAYSSALTINAPRHSDHHISPARPYPALRINPREMPCLPRSLPVMAMIALMPSVWKRMMDKRCTRWTRGPGKETKHST